MTAGIQRNGQYGNSPYGIAFVGNDATLVVNRNRWELRPEDENAPVRTREDGKESHGAHVRNFLDCIKSRATPDCPPEAGRAAAQFVHTANIAARLQEPMLNFNQKAQRFTGAHSGAANDFLLPNYAKGWKLPKV